MVGGDVGQRVPRVPLPEPLPSSQSASALDSAHMDVAIMAKRTTLVIMLSRLLITVVHIRVGAVEDSGSGRESKVSTRNGVNRISAGDRHQ